MKIKILFLLLPLFSFAQIIRDGDSFNYNGLEIRLYNIDALESNQAHSQECKAKLTELIKGKVLRYEVIKYDRYNRAICRVFVNNKDISLEMVRSGYAFVYYRYCTDSNFFRAEKEAKRKKLGIWKYNNINPEKFRKL